MDNNLNNMKVTRCSESEILNSWGIHPPSPCGTKRAQISLNLVLTFSTVYILSYYFIRVMALCVEEPQLGYIISGRIHSEQQDTPRQLQVAAADNLLFTTDRSLSPSPLLEREYGHELTHSLGDPRSHQLKTINVTGCKKHPVSFLLVSTQEM